MYKRRRESWFENNISIMPRNTETFQLFFTFFSKFCIRSSARRYLTETRFLWNTSWQRFLCKARSENPFLLAGGVATYPPTLHAFHHLVTEVPVTIKSQLSRLIMTDHRGLARASSHAPAILPWKSRLEFPRLRDPDRSVCTRNRAP